MIARRIVIIFLIAFAVAASVRVLTLQFMRARLNDPGWFQHGSYQVFDQRARAMLHGHERLFWIDDPSRTDLAQYPPAFPWWVAAIYHVTGDWSAYSVQRIQWILDLILTMLLASAIGVIAFGWRAGATASFMVALSPVLAINGVSPAVDAPTNWFVLGGILCALLALKRDRVLWACLAGAMFGIACWFRVNPLLLSGLIAFVVFFGLPRGWRRRSLVSGALLFSALLVVSPILIRNYVVFPDFTVGGTVGVNLWEGLGETELGRENGFLYGDDKMLESERSKMGYAPDFPLKPMWPDGIKRERERTRESLEFIKKRPIWYAGVMVKRMWGMLKVAGEPVPYSGTMGINVTSQKTLPPERQGGALALFVNLLGMIQSLARYALLPLAVVGIWFGLTRYRRMSCVLLAVIFYYLVPGTFAHTEIRYVLSMHVVIPIFAGLGLWQLIERSWSTTRKQYRE